MGRRFEVDWVESVEDLKQLYRREQNVQRRERLQVLWHLRQGKRIQDVVAITGTGYRVIQKWLAWYRDGGLSEVLARTTGHGATGQMPYLSAMQQRALAARVQLGDFRTVWDVVEWVEARWGIRYSYEGMRSVMKRNRLSLQVPRPQSQKANPTAQQAWKKGGYRSS